MIEKSLKLRIDHFMVAVGVVVSLLTGLLVASNKRGFDFMAMGGIIGLLVLAMMAKRELLIYILILSSMLASGSARGFIIPYFRFNEVILILVCGVFILLQVAAKRSNPSVRGNTGNYGIVDFAFLMVFLTRVVLSVLLGAARGDVFDLMFFVRAFGVVQYYLIYRIVFSLVSDKKAINRIIHLLVLCSAVIGVIAVLQSMNLFGVRELITQWQMFGWRVTLAEQNYYLARGRGTSLLEGWNSLGAYSSMYIVFIVGWLQIVKPKRRTRIFFILALILNVLGLVSSGSFTGVVMLVVGLLLMQILLPRLGHKSIIKSGYLLLFILIGALAFFLFRDSIEGRISMQYGGGQQLLVPETMGARITLWSDYIIPYMVDHPISVLLGVGTKGITLEENYYLYLTWRYSIFALIAHLLLVFVLIKMSYHFLWKTTYYTRVLALGGFIMVIQLSVASLTGMYFEYSGVAETLWIVFGLLSASYTKLNG